MYQPTIENVINIANMLGYKVSPINPAFVNLTFTQTITSNTTDVNNLVPNLTETFAIAKGAKISADGGAADLISSSSELGNIANLVEEHAPWLAPEFMAMLAIRPEDNPWLARIKTVTAGGGMNHVAHFVGAFGKGLWRSRNFR